jgi:hypothetical protein
MPSIMRQRKCIPAEAAFTKSFPSLSANGDFFFFMVFQVRVSHIKIISRGEVAQHVHRGGDGVAFVVGQGEHLLGL